MQGFHDMRGDDDTPHWMLYAVLFGLGVVSGLLVSQILLLM